MNKRILSILLAVIMVFTMIPLTAVATENDYVYISVSYDDKFKEDKNGKPMAYIPVSFENLASVDLNEYGLTPILQALQIDWNGAQLKNGSTVKATLNTTGEMLSILQTA
jgi:hypothetical protein